MTRTTNEIGVVSNVSQFLGGFVTTGKLIPRFGSFILHFIYVSLQYFLRRNGIRQ
jgi:hypothetical protein